MELIFDIFGYSILIALAIGMLYAFVRILSYGLNCVTRDDDE